MPPACQLIRQSLVILNIQVPLPRHELLLAIKNNLDSTIISLKTNLLKILLSSFSYFPFLFYSGFQREWCLCDEKKLVFQEKRREIDASLSMPTAEPDSIQTNSIEASHWELHWEISSEIGSHAEKIHLLCLLWGTCYCGKSHVVEQLSEFT